MDNTELTDRVADPGPILTPIVRPGYGVGLLDDLHTHFPELLYNQGRFGNIGDVLGYVYDVAVNSNEEFFLDGIRAHHSESVPRANRLRDARRLDEYYDSDTVTDEEAKEEESESEQEEETAFHNLYSSITYMQRARRGREESDESEESEMHNSNTRRPRLNISSIFQNENLNFLRNFLIHPPIGSIPSTAHRLSSVLGINPAALNNFLEPVPIVPTQDHIDMATILYIADAADAEFNCTICQERFEPVQEIRRIEYCSHIFHHICIDQWFLSSVRCPLCRHDIRELIDESEMDDSVS